MNPLLRKKYLLDCLPQLKDYLLSEVLYWPMGSYPYPLTIGNLMLEKKIQSEIDPSMDRKISDGVEKVKLDWKSKWEVKAEKEFVSRLRLWTDYIGSLADDQQPSTAQFKNEVRNRVILQLLLNNTSQTLVNLEAVDEALKKYFISSSFFWEIETQAVFDQHEFWFLYGKLKI